MTAGEAAAAGGEPSKKSRRAKRPIPYESEEGRSEGGSEAVDWRHVRVRAALRRGAPDGAVQQLFEGAWAINQGQSSEIRGSLRAW